MKERAPPTQPNKSSGTAGSSEGSDRCCEMSKEMERHVKDMHAKAGWPSATPSLRNIKV